jgi:N-glycosylase/DNA lyase
MRLSLDAPPGFCFERTLYSHGWCRLPPFRVSEEGPCLEGVVERPEGGALAYRLSVAAGKVVVESPGRGDTAARRLLGRTARRVLNLDLDLSGFYDSLRHDDRLGWIARSGAGRMLRAPTLYEDLIKLILTTNCTWAFTTRMVASLVERYGVSAPDGRRAFPGADALAGVGARELRRRCSTGYRAPALAQVAREVSRGRIDPEAWQSDPREPAELRREMLELPGVGPYVAENVLRLIGRPIGLGLDSWLRAKYARVYHGGRRVTDRTIARRYARLGAWGSLALWCDMTRDWLTEDRPSEAGISLG